MIAEGSLRNQPSSPPQDALSNLLKRSRIHFLHCLDPGTPQEPQPPTEASGAAPGLAWDVPALRAQLSGSLILEALRLHRIGTKGRFSGSPCRVQGRVRIADSSWVVQL